MSHVVKVPITLAVAIAFNIQIFIKILDQVMRLRLSTGMPSSIAR